jgi:heptosyltransferase III
MTPERILVLCTRRLGDVLLTTPLIRSLRRAWPAARIDALTLDSSAAALAGNPDLARVITVRERAPLAESLRAAGRPRHYDLAVSTLYNDRPHLLALWSAGTRAGVVPPAGEPGAHWKRWLSRWHAERAAVHTVVQYLLLADALGIPRCHEVVPPRPPDERALDALLGAGWAGRPYAVVHPAPLYVYKAWTLEGWRGLVRWLLAQGLKVVLTGGAAAPERALAARVAEGVPGGGVVDASGRLRLADLTPLIGHARLFAGPDTSVTHLAAATGTPTIALFGPSDPVVWGPWPQGHAAPGPGPWARHAPLQQLGNVHLLQGLGHCVPCLLEGCERRLESRSRCLEDLPLARVTAVAAAALAARAAA